MSFIVSNTYDIHATASLDLQFANKKSLVDQISGRNLIDHTRQSSATYVGSDGLIKTAVTNLLTYSEQFDQWTVTSTGVGSNPTVTVNQAEAPDGSITADEIYLDINGGTTSSDLSQISESVSITSGITYVASVYLKTTDGTSKDVMIVNPTGATNLVTVTNEWQRYTVTDTASSSISSTFRIRLRGSESTSDSANLYAWGAQVEESSTVGEYVKTTSTKNSAPRFDHDPETGESLGLLVEESRANQITYSEDFEDTSWSKFNISITGTSSVSPDGGANATEFTPSSANSRVYVDLTTSEDDDHTFSVFAKAGTGRYVTLRSPSYGTDTTIGFDLVGGTAQEGGIITDFGNGWYRCSMTFDTNGDQVGQPSIYLATTLGGYSGDVGETFYLWGAQLEKGSFPTSYIPTEGLEFTRAADVASISGTNFSSWYRQDEGTLYVDALPVPTSGFPSSVVSIDDNTINNRIEIIKNNNQCPLAAIIYEGTGQESLTDAAATFAQQSQVAFGFMQDDQALYQGGSLVESDLSITMPTVNRMRIGLRITDDEYLNGTISRLTYWPTRLPNDTLKTITT